MTNREVAMVLDNIADILQIKDENPFKIRAYRKAAESIYHLDEDLKDLLEQERLQEIPGVGKAVKDKISELMETGSCRYYEKLLNEVPQGVLDMLAIPGVGHKTVKTVFEQLGIQSPEELLQAARQKKIRNLRGMGGKTEYNIIKGMEILKKRSGKSTLGFALPAAIELAEYLRSSEAALQVSLVGSIRRGSPLIGDIDILVASRDEPAIRRKAKNYRDIKSITADEEGRLSGTLTFNLPFEIIIVDPQDYYTSLFITTGCKAHVSRLLGNSPPGLLIGCRSEAEVYQRMQLPFIAPELRENRGEVEKASLGQLPALIEVGDIKGDLHVHSRWSDGAGQIEEMADAARNLGYSYLAITDHSKSLPVSGGINEDKLRIQGLNIDRLNAGWDDFKVLKGIEVDILKGGELDFASDILKDLDVVIASIHSNFNYDQDKQTERIISAIKNPDVDIIGHLTGRLLNRRPGYEVDLDRVLEEAARNQVILEINSHPDRLDIDEHTARQAKDRGIKIAINSDGHHPHDLNLLQYGVQNARRGWLEKKDVVNSWELDELLAFLRK